MEKKQIREHVTINTGTKLGGGLTSIGNDCLFMTGSHVTHDVKINNKVIIAIVEQWLACVIEDDVIIGGLSGIHQFVRIGGAIVGAVTMVTKDAIPGLVQSLRRFGWFKFNRLKRKGVERDDITALRAAFKTLAQGDGTFQDKAKRIGEETTNEYVDSIVQFILGSSDRALTPDDFRNG